MNSQSLVFRSSSATHTGMVRQLNEDSLISKDNIGLWAVADGMGGHQAGEVASQQVIHALSLVSAADSIDHLLEATKLAIGEANSSLVGMSRQYDGTRMPGSTVVALLIQDKTAIAVWAGDSRIYHSKNGKTKQVSKDHSHVQELVDQNLIKAEEAESHPMSNVITRAVGIEATINLDSVELSVDHGDRFLLCSDGLSKTVSFEEIQDLMMTEDLEECVQSLLHTALLRGAPDNVTLISVECVNQATVKPY